MITIKNVFLIVLSFSTVLSSPTYIFDEEENHLEHNHIKIKVDETTENETISLQITKELKTAIKSVAFKRLMKRGQRNTNCIFSGTDSENFDNWLVISRCKHLRIGAASIDGQSYVLKLESHVDQGTMDEIHDHEHFSDVSITAKLPEKPPYYRIWNPDKEEFVPVDHKQFYYGKVAMKPTNNTAAKYNISDPALSGNFSELVNETMEFEIRNRTENVSKVDEEPKEPPKLKTAHLELGAFIDESLWLQFLDEFGSEKVAEDAIDEFVDYQADLAQILFSHQSMDREIIINLAQPVTIWKSQPKPLPNLTGSKILKYFHAVSKYIKPKKAGLDHATVFTGLRLLMNISGKVLAPTGVGALRGVCTNYALSVLNAKPYLYRGGYTLAHEIGHTLGMCHDGDKNCPSSIYCNKYKYLMTGHGVGHKNSFQWSNCSVGQFRAQWELLNHAGRNCLLNPVIPEKLNLSSYPGQRYPPQAQVYEKYGRCSTHQQGFQRNKCRFLFVKKIDGQTWSIGHPLTEGSYCTRNKICLNGECTTTNELLEPVDGGWSGMWDTELQNPQCGGDGCRDTCNVVGQHLLSPEWRKCDNPFPNNGGKSCRGSNLRVRKCDDSSCKIGSSPDDYYLKLCLAKYPHTAKTKVDRECKIRCIHLASHKYRFGFYYTLSIIDGMPCGTKNSGYCVQGQCFNQCKSHPDYFVMEQSNCPTDCIYMNWENWGTCSTSCGRGLQARTRNVRIPPSKGGNPCNMTSLVDIKSCQTRTCPGIISYTKEDLMRKFQGMLSNLFKGLLKAKTTPDFS